MENKRDELLKKIWQLEQIEQLTQDQKDELNSLKRHKNELNNSDLQYKKANKLFDTLNKIAIYIALVAIIIMYFSCCIK